MKFSPRLPADVAGRGSEPDPLAPGAAAFDTARCAVYRPDETRYRVVSPVRIPIAAALQDEAGVNRPAARTWLSRRRRQGHGQGKRCQWNEPGLHWSLPVTFTLEGNRSGPHARSSTIWSHTNLSIRARAGPFAQFTKVCVRLPSLMARGPWFAVLAGLILRCEPF